LKITTKEGQAAAAAAAKGRPERQRTKDERMLGDLPPFDRERAERLLSYREGMFCSVSLFDDTTTLTITRLFGVFR
jgi:hypothetical protein